MSFSFFSKFCYIFSTQHPMCKEMLVNLIFKRPSQPPPHPHSAKGPYFVAGPLQGTRPLIGAPVNRFICIRVKEVKS